MEGEWIDTFSNGISAMGNANSLTQHLNLAHHVHLLQLLLYEEHHHIECNPNDEEKIAAIGSEKSVISLNLDIYLEISLGSGITKVIDINS